MVDGVKPTGEFIDVSVYLSVIECPVMSITEYHWDSTTDSGAVCQVN